MPVRVGLPSSRISTKLYGVIALLLATVFALVVITIRFAGATDATASRFQAEGINGLALASRVQVLMEQHRRLVAMAPLATPDSIEQDESAFRALNSEIFALLDQLAPGRTDKLSERFALLASQGAAVFALARDQERDQARAAAVRHAAAADGLTLETLMETRSRLRAAENGLDALRRQARELTAQAGWVALVTGLLIGPLGLLTLYLSLSRLQQIGSALNRLARNDTSVEIAGVNAHDEFGHLARSVAVFKAKSIELLNKKDDFERLNLQLDAAINNMPLGLSMFDAQQRLLVCNKRYAEMYEVPADLTERGTAHCALWEHRTKRGARHSETREGAVNAEVGAPTMQIEFGNGRIVSVARQPLKGGGWVSLHEDVTERRRQEEKITHLARHDALTGLANRVLFREQLEQSLQRLARGQGFAVLCLDLDHFKAVNDVLGHPIGDALLKQVSQRLLSCVRHGDLVARLGGDEFAIVQSSVRDPNQTESLAARIVKAICAPFQIDGNPITIGTSIGITLAPRDGADADKLLKNADLALYRAKGAGRRGYAFFEAQMHEEIQSRRSLELDLRRALGQDELELAYQPIVCLKTQRVTGFEALLRWHHPERGLVPTDQFIALAEEVGLISEIGAWALERACAEAVRWPNDISVAINVSATQFLKCNLIECVLQALAQSGLPARRLELEITETVLLQENQNTLAMLHQLRQLGVRIAMDDFGTGYCSLANLRAFPFDTIKIDKGFIADVQRRDDSRAIVESVIGLGRSLGMKTVAEGIENFDQLALVREWGCEQAQGFLLGTPVAPCEIEPLLADCAASLRDAYRAAVPVSPGFAESAAQPASSQAA